MKYVLGICNAVAVALLAYVILLTSRHLNTLEKDYDTLLNKYKTENATEVAYVSEVYHLGDWSTILSDTLSIQSHTGISDESRVRAVKQVGTALSFEETLCSYLVAFDEGLTTIVKPYELISNDHYTLLSNITFTGGTLINYDNGATISIDTTEELMSTYREVRGISVNTPDDKVLLAMKHDRAIFINNILSEAMGHTAYGEQDRVFIPVYADNNSGINTIENQTIMVLSSAASAQSTTTTLAAYTKIEKRMWCEIQGPDGLFYCYSDELPAGYTIRTVHDTEYAAAENTQGRYYIGK